jgi:hypothetical protein
MSEACAGATERLPSIFPGRGSTATSTSGSVTPTTIARGAAVDARRRSRAAGGLPEPRWLGARGMLIAEGSDWFWWYGDDHSSEHDLEFDELFRRHVRNVYRALEKPIPEELFVTNITTHRPDREFSADRLRAPGNRRRRSPATSNGLGPGASRAQGRRRHAPGQRPAPRYRGGRVRVRPEKSYVRWTARVPVREMLASYGFGLSVSSARSVLRVGVDRLRWRGRSRTVSEVWR